MRPQDLSKGAPPLYAQIYQALKDDIRAGVYREGERIPTERELQERCGVSRITVRQAVLALEREGLVVRERGKGTLVSRGRKIRETLPRIKSFTDEMIERGMTPGARTVRVKKRKADETLAAVFRCPVGTELMYIFRVRTGNDRPLVVFETWLNVAAELPMTEESYGGSLYALLERCGAAPPAGVEEQFEAVLADRATASQLEIAPGAPVMRRTRIGYDGDMRVQEYTVCRYDAARYHYIVYAGIAGRKESSAQ